MTTANLPENIELTDKTIPPTKPVNAWLLPVLLFLLLGGLVGYLWYRLNVLEKTVADLQSDQSNFLQIMTRMDAELSHTTALAENANNYAHSHNYSDAALKTGVEKLTITPDQLLSIQAVRFFWTPEAQKQFGLGSDPQVGFLAQEVEKTFPELVWTDPQGYKHVDYEHFNVLLFEAMRVQQAQIEELKNH